MVVMVQARTVWAAEWLCGVCGKAVEPGADGRLGKPCHVTCPVPHELLLSLRIPLCLLPILVRSPNLHPCLLSRRTSCTATPS
jgi:hypothetical protein